MKMIWAPIMSIFLLLVVLMTANTSWAVQGPDFNPPFDSGGTARQEVSLAVQNFLDRRNDNQYTESVSLVAGNKRISIRETSSKDLNTRADQIVTLFVNDKAIMKFSFTGSYRKSQNQWVSFVQNYDIKNVTLTYDKQNKTARWANHYQLPDGSTTAFNYQLKDLGESRVELSWDTGYSLHQAQQFNKAGNQLDGIGLYMTSSNDYRKTDIKINQEAITLNEDAQLKNNERQMQALWNGKFNRLDYNQSDPTQGFSVTSNDAMNSNVEEVFRYGRYDLDIHLNLPVKGRLVIDLLQSSLAPKHQTPPVEGYDFWAMDALHYPQSPVRNLFPNPSFEQGLRYWRWWSGGAHYQPSSVKRFAIDQNIARFGSSSLVINPTQLASAPLMSFSLPGIKGKQYTISFYGKSDESGPQASLGLFSTKDGGQYGRSHVDDTPMHTLTDQWQRFSQTFVSDGAPIATVLRVNNNGRKVWIDGIQYEQGDKPTDYISPAIQGCLLSSDPFNNIESGKAVDAILEIRGDTQALGKVELSLVDFFKKTIWEKSYPVQVGQKLSLAIDSLNLATGVYILKADFAADGNKPYTDYFRFAIIDSLDGKQATKNLYGALFTPRMDQFEEFLELLQRLGFGGSASYGEGKMDPLNYILREKYNITDYTHTLMEGVWIEKGQDRFKDPDYLYLMSLNPRIWRRPEMAKQIQIKDRYDETDVKRIEEIAYRCAQRVPEARVWAFGTEEEILLPPITRRKDYKEVAKLLVAFHRGIKRANPDAIVLPSGGTSGYSKVRGHDAIEGYLSSTEGIIKWDAVAVHPYGSCDGTLGQTDLDQTIQMLSDSMKKFGYGQETPIYFNEGGGQGKPALWGDGPDYSYTGGPPSYDQGLREFMHACYMARQYIICLKYWPRLEHFNCWTTFHNTVLDHNLTPTTGLLGINTLGHLLGNPTFISDIRPAPGTRGYSFVDENGLGVAALWCTIDDVDRGYMRGPVMSFKPQGPLPQLIDLMGKRYDLEPDQNGIIKLQLSPAPLFLRGSDPKQLTESLKKATIAGAGSSVQIAFKPSLEGAIKADLQNLTSNTTTGSIAIDKTDVSFTLAGGESKAMIFPVNEKPQTGKMFQWNKSYQIKQPDTKPQTQSWEMDYFYVPHIKSPIDWDSIPAIPMNNMFRPTVNLKQTPGGHPGDINATFKLAWDESNLYLRVDAQDDHFNPVSPTFWSSSEAQKNHLYLLDGCLEVYFDCGANGRMGNGGFDMDDYRYDFSVNNEQGRSGPGLVNRLREVFTEYAGGVEFPTKEEASKKIKCEFTRISETKYAYTITFAQRYLEPMPLKKGTVAGFGLYLHDRMDDGDLGNKGLSLATQPGVHCDNKSNLWPLMILAQ